MLSISCIELPNNCSTRIISNLVFVTKEQLKAQLGADIPEKIKRIYGDFKGHGGAVIWSGRADQHSDIAKLEYCGFKRIYEYKSIHGGKRGMVLYVLPHTKENVNQEGLADIEEDWEEEHERLIDEADDGDGIDFEEGNV